MPALQPWTQAVQAFWAPRLSFYDKKLQVLHDLEEDGLLRAFKNQEQLIGGLLGDRDQQFEARADRLILRILRPQPDVSALEHVSSLVLDAVDSPDIRRVSVSLQYLIPLAFDDFSTARLESAKSLLNIKQGVGLEDWDWAILLDGGSEGKGPKVEIEFGIVAAHEAPERLARSVGRVGRQESGIGPDHWRDTDFPPVALFADWTWDSQTVDAETGDSLELFVKYWSTARSDAARLLKHILSQISVEPLDSSDFAPSATTRTEGGEP